jgi:zinc transport system substrate-binding protein
MNTQKVLIFFIGITAIFLFIFAIKGETPKKNTSVNKMHVTASFYPLAFLAEEIGGDKVSVTNLTHGNGDSHH